MPLPKKQKFLQEIVSDAVVCEVCGGGECVCEDE